jgi:hypothetical protein
MQRTIALNYLYDSNYDPYLHSLGTIGTLVSAKLSIQYDMCQSRNNSPKDERKANAQGSGRTHSKVMHNKRGHSKPENNCKVESRQETPRLPRKFAF